jgi:hypothetical protein
LEDVHFPSFGYLLMTIDLDWKKKLWKDYEEEDDTEIHIHRTPVSQATLILRTFGHYIAENIEGYDSSSRDEGQKEKYLKGMQKL